eukprot:Nitzschia sp. Nitz4//scaffold15_size197535//64801//65519//NITZ4_001572-RA/size197535-exonerate_est2genome-gene-0.29-mRNA-1//-1//CDS//3329537697//7344//frame0
MLCSISLADDAFCSAPSICDFNAAFSRTIRLICSRSTFSSFSRSAFIFAVTSRVTLSVTCCVTELRTSCLIFSLTLFSTSLRMIESFCEATICTRCSSSRSLATSSTRYALPSLASRSCFWHVVRTLLSIKVFVEKFNSFAKPLFQSRPCSPFVAVCNFLIQPFNLVTVGLVLLPQRLILMQKTLDFPILFIEFIL